MFRALAVRVGFGAPPTGRANFARIRSISADQPLNFSPPAAGQGTSLVFAAEDVSRAQADVRARLVRQQQQEEGNSDIFGKLKPVPKPQDAPVRFGHSAGFTQEIFRKRQEAKAKALAEKEAELDRMRAELEENIRTEAANREAERELERQAAAAKAREKEMERDEEVT